MQEHKVKTTWDKLADGDIIDFTYGNKRHENIQVTFFHIDILDFDDRLEVSIVDPKTSCEYDLPVNKNMKNILKHVNND